MSAGQWQRALSRALSYLSDEEKLLKVKGEDGALQAILRALSSLRKAAAKETKTLLGQKGGKAERVVQAMQCFASLYQVNLCYSHATLQHWTFMKGNVNLNINTVLMEASRDSLM